MCMYTRQHFLAVAVAALLLTLTPVAYAQDCNNNGIPDECDIDCGPPGGPCDVPGCGQSADCQPNGIPDECELEVHQLAKLLAADGAAGDWFGRSVAVSGDLAIIGAPLDDVGSQNRGSAYVFRRTGATWTQEAKLLAVDGGLQDAFGWGVAISGDLAVVGALGNGTFGSSSGSAYVFRRTSGVWMQEAKLLPTDGGAGAWFGRSVAVSGDLALVGAQRDDDLGDDSGSAYVFRRSGETWTQEAKLLPADGAAGDLFGSSVALLGDVAIVGAHLDDDLGENSGSVYVFRRGAGVWLQEAKLLAADGAAGDGFGCSVAACADLIFVGAAWDAGPKSGLGSAYVFRSDNGNWIHEAKLMATDGAASDYFGYSVAVSGDVAVVGAYGVDDVGTDSGAAYAFRHDGATWAEAAKLLPSDGSAPDYFGYSVAVSGELIMVGAYRDDDLGGQSGSAYAFVVPDCNANGVPDECDIAEGTSADCNANGRPDECDVSNGYSADCNANGIPDECDIAAGTSTDYDLNGVPDECEDCNGNGIPDSCDLDCSVGNCAGHPLGCGGSVDCQPNGVPDECDFAAGTSADCNGNGIPDECDIAGGVSQDCNGNAVPDECDIAAGTSSDYDLDGIPDECATDCNENGIPDICDVDCTFGDCASHPLGCGQSADCQPNGIPDECELEVHQLAKLLAADGTSSDRFGISVAVAGDAAAVGAYGASAVYVLRRDGNSWIQESKLLPADAGVWRAFGTSVAIADDVVVVGAPADDAVGENSGSAYVFRYDGATWTQEAKLLPPDGATESYFGETLALSAELVVVGAPGEDFGTAYVFRHEAGTWVQEAKLLPTDGTNWAGFGRSVALLGDLAVVGAYWDEHLGMRPGAAYLFRRHGYIWTQEARLLAADGADGDEFGCSVALGADVVLVGARGDGDDYFYTDSGSAYVFRRFDGTWSEEAKLTAADAAGGAHFGAAVAMSGNLAVVGAYGDIDFGNDSGSAYVFRHDDGYWTQEAKLSPPDSAAGDYFGYSVAASGHMAAVGAYGVDDLGSNSGSVRIYTLPDCNGNGVPDECDIADGTSDDCNANGRPDECDLAAGTSRDCNANGIPDECDIAGGTSADYDLNGVPDECEDCSGNGIPDGCDLDCGAGNCASHPLGCGGSVDCQPNGLPDECDLANGTSADCNANDVPDECDIAAGTSTDYDLNGVPDECEDCNENGVPDVCDLDCAVGNCTSHPLGCGNSPDCNSNSVPDECDISHGVSLDCNGNNVPDECEVDVSHIALLRRAGEESLDGFGYRVAAYGNIVLVGAHEDDELGVSSGAAFIFRRAGDAWLQEAKLVPADGAAGDRFGLSVAVSNDVAVVGAPYDDDLGISSGSAYIFRRTGSTWTQEAKLLPADGASGDSFGSSVAISGTVVVVGAENDDDLGQSSGAAYVFSRIGGTWSQEAKLLPPDGAAHDFFGASVALAGQLALVGAYAHDGLATDAGAAYVFRQDGGTWSQEAKLLPDDGSTQDLFSFSVAMAGGLAVIGAPWNDELGDDAGAAYVFRRDGGTWTQEAKLLPGDGVGGDWFGLDVAFADGVAVVGAYQERPGFNSGTAYVLRRDGGTWIQEAKLVAPDETSDDGFGVTVGIAGNVAVVGACDIEWGSDTGSVHVFALPDCNGNGVPDECDIADGTSQDCNGNGIPDECDIAGGTSLDANGNGIPDECELLRGDLNCDGLVNAFDIDPFVLALTDPEAYAAAYPACDYRLADCNHDGLVNAFDIDPFVVILTGGA